MPVYDDRDTDLDELEKAFHAPSSTTSGSQKLEQQKLEDAYNAPDATTSGSDIARSRSTSGTDDGSGSSKHDSSADLKEKEKSTGKDAGDGMNYTGAEDKKSNQKKVKIDKNKFWNKKRAGLFGVTGGTLIGGGIFGLSILAQPSQLLQIGGLLHKPGLNSESTSSKITNQFYDKARAISGRSFKRTVLSKLGNDTFGHPIDQLAKMGVTMKSGLFGQITETHIDTNKLKATFPELDGMNSADAKDFLAGKLSINADQISGSGTNFSIDQRDMGVGDTRLLTGNTVSLLDNGKIVSGIKTRLLFKIFDLPSVLHPFSRARASLERSAENKISGTKEQKEGAADALEEAELDEAAAPVIEEGQPAVDDVKNTNGLYSTVGKALTFTAGACMVRSVASKIPVINRLRVAIPAAIAAARLIAAAEQMKAGGKDITAAQVGNLLRSLNDAEGKGILNNNAPMEELASGSHTKYAPDITTDLQTPFSDKSTAENFEGVASDAIGGEDAAAALCSTPGQIAQGAISLIGIVADVVGEIGSAGTLTPAIAGELAAKAGTAAYQTVITAVALHYVEKFVLSETTHGQLSSSLIKGPIGGAILAYGARELANIGATSSGGVDLGNNTSTALLNQELKQDQQQFESENFFARVFDAYDSRSLLGHFMSDVSPSYGDNLISFSEGFLHMSSAFSSVFSGLLPKVGAEAAPQEVTGYDWTFGQSGIPPQLLNDPNIQDPYTNGDDVATVLDATCLSGGAVDSSCSYATRISACFGNTLTYEDGMWDVLATQDADPHQDAYINADCNDIGTPADTVANNATGIWRRMIMFVNGTHIVKAAACFQGNEQSCTDEGLSGGIGASDSDSSTNSDTDSSDDGTSAYNYWTSPATAEADLAAIGITP